MSTLHIVIDIYNKNKIMKHYITKNDKCFNEWVQFFNCVDNDKNKCIKLLDKWDSCKIKN
jgi:hypothetical protein